MERAEKTGIAYVRQGAGDPVVFLHAMAGSATAWAQQVQDMSARYDCIAWDMPGFGESDAVDEHASMDDLSDKLAAFVEELGVTRAHFVGLSVGGMLLQTHAVRHAGQVASLVILDSSPKFGADGGSDPQAFEDAVLGDLGPDASTDAFSASMCKAITGTSCSQEALDVAIAAMSRGRREGLRLTTRLIARHDATAHLGDIAVPTLVMAGEEDTDTPPAYARMIAEAIPGAQLKIIPRAGHISNIENPEGVTRALEDFLALPEVSL